MEQRLSLIAILIFLALGSAVITSAQETAPLSPKQKALLRPAVKRDLSALLQSLLNEAPTAAEVAKEFDRCKFTLLNLGPLGEAVIVEAQPGHGMTNAAMLNVYVQTASGYRPVIKSQGFGPYVLPRRDAPPDLVFGWASGVCTAKYYRYHYASGEYIVNGCAEEDREGKLKPDEYCAIKACGKAEELAVFDPPVNKMSSEDSPKPDGPSCVPAPALDPAQALADSAQPKPHNQVQFVLAPRTTGDCQPGSVEGGIWTTSDQINTRIDPQGLATCIHPTPKPAVITFTGKFKESSFSSSSLTCK